MSFFEAVLLMVAVLLFRFVLLKNDLRSVVRFSFALMIFFAFRLFLNTQSYGKTQVLVHHLNKNVAVSVRDHGKVYFWIDEKTDASKFLKYTAEPYAVAVRVGELKVLKMPIAAQSFSFNGKKYALK